MEIINTRVARDNESTLGILTVNGEKIGFVIEDEHRDIKVANETRIPAGVYNIGFIEQDTPLTLKYRRKFDWFTYHLELKNVPNFTGIYIHIGNFESNTSGCQIVGYKAGFDSNTNYYRNFESTEMFKELYTMISEALSNGEEVYYEIINKDGYV